MSDPVAAQAPGATGASLFDRTVERLGRMLREAAGSARVRLTGEVRPALPEEDLVLLRRQLDLCVEGKGGEVAARGRAAELAQTYLRLDATGRARFLLLLTEEYGVDRDRLAKAAQAWLAAPDEGGEAALRLALASPRLRLFTQFAGVPAGVKYLVDLRRDVISMGRGNPRLGALDDELRTLLSGWFDVGFLELRRIDWNAPAALLEKLIAYEAVHAIRSWNDLKNRLDSDRRCYAFFHPRMPAEPLIFVEVALVSGMAANVQELLDEQAPSGDPAQADTAIFYSISNCQAGLAGVSFGNFLIKRVVEELGREFGRLAAFATLSPIPGLRSWVEQRLAGEELTTLLTDAERNGLRGWGADDAAALGAVLAAGKWPDEPGLSAALQAPLSRLCAGYLLQEKGRGGRALDRVAHFHLSNGARVERINWRGDLSPGGLAQSFGLMVNYRYKLDEIEANHDAYAGGEVPASAAVRRLLRG